MQKTFYLIVNGKRDARVVRLRPSLRLDEVSFRVVVNFPEPRTIAGEIVLTIDENIVTVDGVEMIPLSLVRVINDDA